MTANPCDVAAAIAHTHRTTRTDRPIVWTTTTPGDTVTEPDPDATSRECVSCRQPFTVKAGQTLTLCPKCRRAPYDQLISRAETGPEQATITVDRYGRLVVDSAEQRADRRGPNR